MKRKFDIDLDDSPPLNPKQLKLIPFPNYQPDTDVAMSDVDPTDPHHTRIPSDASTSSSISSGSLLDLCPFQLFPSDGNVDYTKPSQQIVGLMQPSSSFAHHGTGCSQIPKLRLACSASPGGRRTMWSHCEQCGAISMVDNID